MESGLKGRIVKEDGWWYGEVCYNGVWQRETGKNITSLGAYIDLTDIHKSLYYADMMEHMITGKDEHFKIIVQDDTSQCSVAST